MKAFRDKLLLYVLILAIGIVTPTPMQNTSIARAAAIEEMQNTDLSESKTDSAVDLAEDPMEAPTNETGEALTDENRDKPEDITEAPEDITKTPEDTTEAPEDITEAPEDITDTPEDTTETPEDTTETPEDTTETPEDTTETPEDTTETPEDITEEPQLTLVTLRNKTVTYNKKTISIDKAVVDGSTGDITYTYYTDKSCNTLTSKSANGAAGRGLAPRNAGTYYVIAAVEADDEYEEGVSNTAKLTIKKAESTIKLKAKTTTYTGKTISIGKATVKGSDGKVTYAYYVDKSCKTKTTKSNSGSSDKGSAPKKPGTYYVKAKVAENINYRSATSSAAKLTIEKLNQKISVKTTEKEYKTTDLSGGSRSFSIGAKATSGSISCKKESGSSKLSINKSGSITVAKGTSAGTYTIKVKITASSSGTYKSATKTQTITVTVKSVPKKQAAVNKGGTVYWVPNGKVYHLSRNCRTLSRSKTVHSGSKSASGKPRACKVCS